MSTQRDHVDPILEEIPVTSSGEEVDPKVLDLAMKIAEKMFLKMKEEDTKEREEEESRRKAEEDKGKGKIEYNDDCWGPSASEGPQKRDLTMFSKYASRYLRNQESGCGYTEAWSRRSLTRMVITTKDKMITKLYAEELRHHGKKGKPT